MFSARANRAAGAAVVCGPATKSPRGRRLRTLVAIGNCAVARSICPGGRAPRTPTLRVGDWRSSLLDPHALAWGAGAKGPGPRVGGWGRVPGSCAARTVWGSSMVWAWGEQTIGPVAKGDRVP